MRLFIIIFLMFALSGCGKSVWDHREHSSQNQFEKDKRECEYDSIKYGQTNDYYRTAIVAGFADAMRQQEIFNSCMNAKGYYLVKQQ